MASQTTLVLIGTAGLWLLWRRQPTDPQTRVVLQIFAVVGLLTIAMIAVGPPGMRYRISLAGFWYLGVGSLLARSWLADARARHVVTAVSGAR